MKREHGIVGVIGLLEKSYAVAKNGRQSGCLVYGSYCGLLRGRYEVTFF
jgi:hypothetical protein